MATPVADSWQLTLIAALKATPGILGAASSGNGRAGTWTRIGGNGSVSVWALAVGGTRFFVKAAPPDRADMLSAEVEALAALGEAGALRVPQVYGGAQAKDAAVVALEWLDIADGGRDAMLGRALAALHAAQGPGFGWHRDNHIGMTPQDNAWSDDWAAFFRDRRLAPQLALAARNGYTGPLVRGGEALLRCVPALLDGHHPAPSLLHGDLWAGNAGRLADGTPVVFDPASYYGDREADLAMTELFGGFAPEFYAAYAEAPPLAPGYPLRRTLYNCYHVLNHLNLFGAAYFARAESMVAELLAAAH
jgi:protein-ribulosamine 3-kinase